MSLIASLPIKLKLPLVIVGLCLATGLTLGVVVQLDNVKSAEMAVHDKFTALTMARQRAISSYLRDLELTLVMTTKLPRVQEALTGLGTAFDQVPEPAKTLAEADLTAVPPQPEEGAPPLSGLAAYQAQHAEFDPFLQSIKLGNDLYDIFLFDADFNAIYTAAKEPDFAANFYSGDLAASPLGQALAESARKLPGTMTFGDFAPYGPSKGIFAAFVVARIDGQDGEVLGYLAFQLNTGRISAILENFAGTGETVHSFMVGGLKGSDPSKAFSLGLGAAGDAPLALGKLADLPQISQAVRGAEGFLDGVVLSDGSEGYAKVTPVTFAQAQWSLVIEQGSAEVLAGARHMSWNITVASLLVCLAAAGLGLLASRSLTGPLDRARQAIDGLARDDLGVAIADTDRHDELGGIAKSLGLLKEKLHIASLAEADRLRAQEDQQQVVTTLSEGLEALALGDLTQTIDQPFASEYETLRQNFNSTLGTLSRTMTRVIEASDGIRTRSENISAASDDLSNRTENQAAALEETAAALDQLTASVRSAANGAREVEAIVSAARREAEDSGQVVRDAVSAMSEIEKSSQQISQIISAIDDIAFQTNLLALNAGVEAARAGDAGRGFAVVASEVRALAQRSSVAAKEIKTLIVASAHHVGRGVEEVGKAGVALQSIVGSVTNISNLVSTIASGSAEQSTGLAEINIGVTQLDQVTQQNAAMVGQNTALAQALNQDATTLSGLVAGFRLPEAKGEGDRNIVISQFVPTTFLGPEALADDTPEEEVLPEVPVQREPLARVASGGTAAMWQDF